MGFLIFDVLLGLWVLVNARKRGANPYPWAIWTALIGPFILPLYLAKRPLLDGEVREGGGAWNITKNFALAWTLFMFVGGIIGLIASASLISSSSGGAEAAGTIIGTGLGLGLIAFLWFIPFVIALLIGLLLRKSSIVERGPILASQRPSRLGTSGIIGLLLLVLICIGVTRSLRDKPVYVEQEPLIAASSTSESPATTQQEPVRQKSVIQPKPESDKLISQSDNEKPSTALSSQSSTQPIGSSQEDLYIRDNLILYEFKAKYMDSILDGRVPGITFKLRNKGNKTLDRVKVVVYFKDSSGAVITEEEYSPVLVSEYNFIGDNKPLKPGYVWQMENNKFYSAKSVPSEWKEGAAEIKIKEISFAK